jgi:hypothetical protein
MFGVSGILIGIVIVVLAFVYANFFEYALHRWLIHRLRGFVKREHLLHHSIFRGDHRYHVLRSEDCHFILFKWWQGPVIVASHLPALWIIGVFTGWPVVWPGLLVLPAEALHGLGDALLVAADNLSQVFGVHAGR